MDSLSLIEPIFILGFVAFMALAMMSSNLAASVARLREVGERLFPDDMDLRGGAFSKNTMARAVLFSRLPLATPGGLRVKFWLYRVIALVYAICFLVMAGVALWAGVIFVLHSRH